jgi:hypothetical protein
VRANQPSVVVPALAAGSMSFPGRFSRKVADGLETSPAMTPNNGFDMIASTLCLRRLHHLLTRSAPILSRNAS